MTLTVDPAEQALHHTHLAVGEEQRRSRRAAPETHHAEPALAHSDFDAAAPVSVDPDTEAAVADLHAVGAVTMATALSRYSEDG